MHPCLLAVLVQCQATNVTTAAAAISFHSSREVSLSDYSKVAEQTSSFQWRLHEYRKDAALHVLRSILSTDEAAVLVAAVPSEINIDEDSVDASPTFEWPIESRYDDHQDIKLKALTQPIVTNRVLPYIQSKYNCSGCRMCTSMIRRYLPKERRQLRRHFDGQSFVTVVISLSEYGSEYTGGLFVRSGSETSRRFVDLGTGDAAVHQVRMVLPCGDSKFSTICSSTIWSTVWTY